MHKLLTLVILFSTAVRAVLVAKVIAVRISPLASLILAKRVVLVATLVILDILSSIFFILAIYTSFLTASFFTAWLSFLKPTVTGTNLSTSNLSISFFKLQYKNQYEYQYKHQYKRQYKHFLKVKSYICKFYSLRF